MSLSAPRKQPGPQLFWKLRKRETLREYVRIWPDRNLDEYSPSLDDGSMSDATRMAPRITTPL